MFLATLLVFVTLAVENASARYTSSHPWIRLWTQRDQSLQRSTRIAAATFKVSELWLRSCNRAEGGNVSRRKLRVSLHAGHGPGWNLSGSYAFGPWQYMLGARPPSSSRQWGTFGRYVHTAFRAARDRGTNVPYRFKRPDSLVGQALTTAFMFKIGQSAQWSGTGC